MFQKKCEVTGLDALERLKTGNERFVNNVRSLDSLLSQQNRSILTQGQTPFAIILGCSDSRVPAELVFDQGFGDLFVIRVAGNIVAPSQIGSVEFAATKYNTRLVVVLGHTQCSAVAATIEELSLFDGKIPSYHQRSIIERIAPTVEEFLDTPLKDDYEALLRHSIRANVRASVSHLRHGSEILENLVAHDHLLIIGAEYSLETGHVVFFS